MSSLDELRARNEAELEAFKKRMQAVVTGIHRQLEEAGRQETLRLLKEAVEMTAEANANAKRHYDHALERAEHWRTRMPEVVPPVPRVGTPNLHVGSGSQRGSARELQAPVRDQVTSYNRSER